MISVIVELLADVAMLTKPQPGWLEVLAAW